MQSYNFYSAGLILFGIIFDCLYVALYDMMNDNSLIIFLYGLLPFLTRLTCRVTGWKQMFLAIGVKIFGREMRGYMVARTIKYTVLRVRVSIQKS